MGEPEVRAENQTAAPAENSGAGPQAAGTNPMVLLLLEQVVVEVECTVFRCCRSRLKLETVMCFRRFIPEPLV